MEPEDYLNINKKTCWKLSYTRLSFNQSPWIAIHVLTGRKYWPLITFKPNIHLGLNAPELENIQKVLKYYTFPELQRFVEELNIELSYIYGIKINIKAER